MPASHATLNIYRYNNYDYERLYIRLNSFILLSPTIQQQRLEWAGWVKN